MILPTKLQTETSFHILNFVNLGLWLSCFLLLAPGLLSQEKPPANEVSSPEQAFQSAQTFQVAGDYEKAASAYREAIAGGLQRLGNLRLSHKEYAEGVDLLTRAVQIVPARAAAHVDLAISQFEARDFDKAKTEIEIALQQDPRDFRALNVAGKIYFMRGEYQAAAERLESAIGLQPDFDTGYLLALANLELKKTAPASVIFDEALASAKRNASTHALIGLAYRETGYFEQAVAHFSKAIELELQKPPLRSSLGLTYFLQGPPGYANAREQLLSDLAITPDDFSSLYYLGMIAAGEKKTSEAEKWFERAAAAHPDEPDAWFRLGQAYFEDAKWEQALAALRKSSSLTAQEGGQADLAPIHELMGKVLEKLGRHNEAESEAAQAEQLRSQQTKPESQQKPNSTAESGKAEQIGRSGPQELRSMLLQTLHGAELPNTQEKDYIKRMSALLGEVYYNLGDIVALDSRYVDAASDFAEAALLNPNIYK